MAVYAYNLTQIESTIRAAKRSRLCYCATATGVLAAAPVVAFLRPEWIFGAGAHARGWVLIALFVFVMGPLGDNLWRWKSRPQKLEQSLKSMRLEVSEQEVVVIGVSTVKRLRRGEIDRAEEVSWGLYLRTSDRYRWIFVPSQVEGYDAFKHEIAQLGIPIIPAAIPPNWEEVVGALVFIATMLCAIFTHSARVLTANLLLSALVAAGGFLILSANPDNLPKMRWVRFGIFLPVAMTASMLWAALKG